MIAEPSKACSPITNIEEVKGKIAIVQRGDCMFVEKVRFFSSFASIWYIYFTNNQLAFDELVKWGCPGIPWKFLNFEVNSSKTGFPGKARAFMKSPQSSHSRLNTLLTLEDPWMPLNFITPLYTPLNIHIFNINVHKRFLVFSIPLFYKNKPVNQLAEQGGWFIMGIPSMHSSNTFAPDVAYKMFKYCIS